MKGLKENADITAWVATLALVSGLPVTAPAPARAAGTADWRCDARPDAPRTLVLVTSDLARTNTDRHTIDLDCTFTATMAGPSQVTLCIAAPEGENGGGPARRLRRRNGNETVEYRLTAQPGDVPHALAVPPGELKPVLQPLYTVPIDHGDAGTVSFRHQFALIAEFQGDAGRYLPEGDYGDTLTGFTASVHEGGDCGFLLWGPPVDSLGTAAEFSTTVRLPATCSISVKDAIDFGTVADLGSGQRDDGALAVQCSPGTAYVLGLGDGNNADGGTRRMALEGPASPSVDYLAYELLQPNGSPWNTAGSSIIGTAVRGTGNGTAQTISVTGRIPAGTAMPQPGQYRDTVVVTLAY